MNYADIKYPDIQDGDGIRVAIYVSGCHFHCAECHNKETWDFSYGKEFTEETQEYIMEILRKPYVNGLSLLGGEPLEIVNQHGLLSLVKQAKEELPDKDIWCWTGYDFEKDILNKMYIDNKITKELLNYIDIIVDGQFEIENKLTNLKFRGSTNQRKIDVQESLKRGELIRLAFGDEEREVIKKPKIMFYEEFKKYNEQFANSTLTNIMPANINQISFLETEKEIQKNIEIKELEETIAAKGIE